jgi:hypothetical protein
VSTYIFVGAYSNYCKTIKANKEGCQECQLDPTPRGRSYPKAWGAQNFVPFYLMHGVSFRVFGS